MSKLGSRTVVQAFNSCLILQRADFSPFVSSLPSCTGKLAVGLMGLACGAECLGTRKSSLIAKLCRNYAEKQSVSNL